MEVLKKLYEAPAVRKAFLALALAVAAVLGGHFGIKLPFLEAEAPAPIVEPAK